MNDPRVYIYIYVCVCVCVCGRTIWSIAEEIGVFIPFPRGISPKVNAIARLEFELSYHDVTGERISHYVTGTPSHLFMLDSLLNLFQVRLFQKE